MHGYKSDSVHLPHRLAHAPVFVYACQAAAAPAFSKKFQKMMLPLYRGHKAPSFEGPGDHMRIANSS